MKIIFSVIFLLVLAQHVRTSCCFIYLYRTPAGQAIRIYEQQEKIEKQTDKKDKLSAIEPPRVECTSGNEADFEDSTAYRGVLDIFENECDPYKLKLEINQVPKTDRNIITTSFYSLYDIRVKFVSECQISKHGNIGDSALLEMKSIIYKVNIPEGKISSNGCAFAAFQQCYHSWVQSKAKAYFEKGLIAGKANLI